MFAVLRTDYLGYLKGQHRSGSRRRCGVVPDMVALHEGGRKAGSQVAGWESPTCLSVHGSAAACLQRQSGTPVGTADAAARRGQPP